MAIIGDTGLWNANAHAVRNSILRAKIKDLVMPGDNNYEERPEYYPRAWNPWKKHGFNFDVVALGNHHGGYAEEIKFFEMPGEWFSKTKGDKVRFIVLNSDNDTAGPKQAQWLDEELQKATERFIFIVYHHPSYDVSANHRWVEKRNFQDAVRPIIWKHRSKITALIGGHDHLAMLVHFNDLPFIISGATQYPRRDAPRNDTQEGVRVRNDWYYQPSPFWVMLQIDDESNEAMVHYVQARTDRITCSAKLITGKEAAPEPNCRATNWARRITSGKRSPVASTKKRSQPISSKARVSATK